MDLKIRASSYWHGFEIRASAFEDLRQYSLTLY